MSWGYAPGAAFGPKNWGLSPNRGRSPLAKKAWPAGQSPASHQAAKPKPASVEATTLDGEGETFRRRSRTFPKNTRDLVQLDEGVLVRWGIV